MTASTSARRRWLPPSLPVLVLSLALVLLLPTIPLAFVLPLRSSCKNLGLRRPHAAVAGAGPRAAAAPAAKATAAQLHCAQQDHSHHHEQVEEAQALETGHSRIRKRDVLFARFPAPWARFRQEDQPLEIATPQDEEEGEEEREGEGRMVELVKASGAVILAAIGPNPWDRGMGINPTPPNALAMWGPYVGTLLFLTFGMRGLEPLKRFLYDRQKRRKQAKKAAQRPKKKNQYYRAPSRLYDMAKAKMEQKQEGGMTNAAQASVAKTTTDGEEGREEEEVEVEEEEEEEEQLSAYRCEVCSFTIYPARGREFKFFPAGFKCPSCGSSKEKFYDLTDPEDPRNQEGSGGGSDEADEDLGDDDAFNLADGEEEEEEQVGAEGDEPWPPAVLAAEPGGIE